MPCLRSANRASFFCAKQFIPAPSRHDSDFGPYAASDSGKARVTVTACTAAAPLALSVLAHSLSVVPVVNTSSTRMIRFPSTPVSSRTANAPFTFSSLSRRLSPRLRVRPLLSHQQVISNRQPELFTKHSCKDSRLIESPPAKPLHMQWNRHEKVHTVNGKAGFTKGCFQEFGKRRAKAEPAAEFQLMDAVAHGTGVTCGGPCAVEEESRKDTVSAQVVGGRRAVGKRTSAHRADGRAYPGQFIKACAAPGPFGGEKPCFPTPCTTSGKAEILKRSAQVRQDARQSCNPIDWLPIPCPSPASVPGSHVVHDGIGESRTPDFLRPAHPTSQIIGDDLIQDRPFDSLLDHPGGFAPPDVIEHHGS